MALKRVLKLIDIDRIEHITDRAVPRSEDGATELGHELQILVIGQSEQLGFDLVVGLGSCAPLWRANLLAGDTAWVKPTRSPRANHLDPQLVLPGCRVIVDV